MADEEHRERIQLSFAQVAASSLAAVSAAVVCSFFGVAGTVIGTAVASVVATAGGAIYSYSLRRTRAKLRRLHQAGAASPPFSQVVRTAREQSGRMLREIPWGIVALGTATAFVFATGVVSAIELNAGESLAALFGVSHSGSRESSFGSALGFGKHHSPKPSTTPSPSSTPSSSTSSTHSPSPSPTATATVTRTPSPTLTPTVAPTSPTNVLSKLLSPSPSQH